MCDAKATTASVWSIGEGGGFDIYASRELAELAVMAIIEQDCYMVDLSASQRRIIAKVWDDPTLAIECYNLFAKEGKRWFVREHEVRDSLTPRSLQ